MRVFIILIAIFLGSCVSTPKIEPSIIIKKEIIYPNIPDIRGPVKSELETVKFDWPRLIDRYSVKNNKKCKKIFSELYPGKDPLSFRLDLNSRDIRNDPEVNTKFWYNCSILGIDPNSNLYIGLTEVEYKKLVNNTNKLLLREKKWKALLKSINSTLSGWRKKNKESEDLK